MLFSNRTFAQETRISTLYVKTNVETVATFSSNSAINIIDNQFYPDNSNEIISTGLGNNYSLSIGCIRKNIFIEVGYGHYTVIQTHHIPVGGPLSYHGYRNVRIPVLYHQIPVTMGYSFLHTKRLTFSTIIGANYLVDLIKVKTNPGVRNKLVKKNKNPYNGEYVVLPNDLKWSTVLLDLGTSANYRLNKHFSIDLAVLLKMGFRTVTNNALFVYQQRNGYVASVNNFSTTKGDALCINIGVRYSLW